MHLTGAIDIPVRTADLRQMPHPLCFTTEFAPYESVHLLRRFGGHVLPTASSKCLVH